MNREEIEVLRKEIQEKNEILVKAERALNADNFGIVLKAIRGTKWEVESSFGGHRIQAYDETRRPEDSNETVTKIQDAWRHPFDVEELKHDGVTIYFDGDGGGKGQGYFITFKNEAALIKFVQENELKIDTWRIKKEISDMEYDLKKSKDFYKLVQPFEAV